MKWTGVVDGRVLTLTVLHDPEFPRQPSVGLNEEDEVWLIGSSLQLLNYCLADDVSIRERDVIGFEK